MEGLGQSSTAGGAGGAAAPNLPAYPPPPVFGFSKYVLSSLCMHAGYPWTTAFR